MKIEKYSTADDIEELLAVRESVDTLLNAHITTTPLSVRADMYDLGGAFQAHFEVPGVDQADLEIAVEGDELLVAGLRGSLLDTSTSERGEIVFSERATGPFQRSISLPAPVKPDAATAHLSRGVLVVTIPKA